MISDIVFTGLLCHRTWSRVRCKWSENSSREKRRWIHLKWPEDVDHKWRCSKLVSMVPLSFTSFWMVHGGLVLTGIPICHLVGSMHFS